MFVQIDEILLDFMLGNAQSIQGHAHDHFKVLPLRIDGQLELGLKWWVMLQYLQVVV